jgi:putative superfamily III holin-X
MSMEGAQSQGTEMTTEELRIRAAPPPGDGATSDRSIGELLRSIGTETSTLIRKEIQLGKQEVMESITARLMAGAAGAVAAVMGLFVLAFLGLAAAAALDNWLRPWASRLIVAGVYLLIAGAAGMFAMKRIKKPPIAPEETVRTVKEDVEWAKAQLKR